MELQRNSVFILMLKITLRKGEDSHSNTSTLVSRAVLGCTAVLRLESTRKDSTLPSPPFSPEPKRLFNYSRGKTGWFRSKVVEEEGEAVKGFDVDVNRAENPKMRARGGQGIAEPDSRDCHMEPGLLLGSRGNCFSIFCENSGCCIVGEIFFNQPVQLPTTNKN